MQPLALADGVEDEHDVAHAGETLAERLVRGFGLAVVRVTAGANHTRPQPLRPLRQVQVRGDEEPGPALEDHFLDGVSVAFEFAGHLRVERRLLRELAEARHDLLARIANVGFGVGLRLELCPPSAAIFSAARTRST